MSLLSKIKSANELLKFSLDYVSNKKMYPKTAVIDLLYGCNLRCKMCNLYDEKTWPVRKKIALYKKGMPFETWKKTLDIFRDKGVKTLIFTGGEPLLHEDIRKILEYSKQKGFVVGLTTNGLLLSEKISQFLVDIGLDSVSISIDGYDKQTYKKIRGPHFDVVFKNVKKLAELIKKEKSKKTAINIASIITNITAEKTEKFVDLAAQLGVFHLHFSRLRDVSDGCAELMLDSSKFSLFETKLDFAIKDAKKRKISTNLWTSKKFFRKKNSVKFCHEIYQTIVINPIGEVFKCCSMKQSLGNILTDGLGGTWFSKEMEKLRGQNQKGKLPKICQECNIDRRRAELLRKFIKVLPVPLRRRRIK